MWPRPPAKPVQPILKASTLLLLKQAASHNEFRQNMPWIRPAMSKVLRSIRRQLTDERGHLVRYYEVRRLLDRQGNQYLRQAFADAGMEYYGA